jgi:hypothetical protein
LRFARCFPTGHSDFLQDGFEIIDRERDMDRSDIARSKIDMFSVGGREIFQQFDFVSTGRFHHREFDLSACNACDLTRHLGGLMRSMRKLETENVLPEVERALEIRDRDASVIGCDDSKGHSSENVQRSTPNVQYGIQNELIWRPRIQEGIDQERKNTGTRSLGLTNIPISWFPVFPIQF